MAALATSHELDTSGVRVNKTCFARCVCGWETDDHPTAHAAAMAMDAHVEGASGLA